MGRRSPGRTCSTSRSPCGSGRPGGLLWLNLAGLGLSGSNVDRSCCTMDGMVPGQAFRWRRRRYARWTRRGRVLRWLRFPTTITLPGGRRYERYAYTFWRIRLPLWIAPAAAGWWVLSWPGIAVGLAVGIVAEVALSYRRSEAPKSTGRPRRQNGGPRGPAGVREPRRPHPTGAAGGAQHAIYRIP